MPDTDDYADPRQPIPPAATGGIRVADRVQVTGWLGLFIAFALAAGMAIALGTGLGPDRLWVGTVLGVTALVFAAAGCYLIVVGFREHPPRGDLLVMANLVVVGPLLGTAFGILLLPYAFVVYLLFVPGPTAVMMAAPTIMGFLTTIPNLVMLVKFRRQVRAFVRAWLDPTAP